MAVATGAPDEEPDGQKADDSESNRISGDMIGNIHQAVVVQSGDIHFSRGVFHSPELDLHTDKQPQTLAEQRQQFHFDFLRQSLKQAEVTFWLSIAFMASGAVVILVGAVLALVYASSADLSYIPLVTALTGALISVGGGALAVHARKAKAHVTEQAQRIGDKADKDEGLQTTLKLIDQVGDKELRDRIRTAVALQALNVTPAPETIASSLLPDPKSRIEPGNSNP